MAFDLENTITVKTLKRRLMACARCDAQLSPEWQFRYFSFDPEWNVDTGEEMGSFRDGQGVEGFFVFGDGGCIGKIYGVQARPDLVNSAANVPEKFRHFFKEPALKDTPTSFVIWGLTKDDKLDLQRLLPQHPEIFAILAKGFDAYYSWAVEYYEQTIDRTALQHVFESHGVF